MAVAYKTLRDALRRFEMLSSFQKGFQRLMRSSKTAARRLQRALKTLQCRSYGTSKTSQDGFQRFQDVDFAADIFQKYVCWRTPIYCHFLDLGTLWNLRGDLRTPPCKSLGTLWISESTLEAPRPSKTAPGRSRAAPRHLQDTSRRF